MGSRKALFCVVLAAATLGLSEWLAAWRAWRTVPGPAEALHLGVLGAGLLGAGLWLGFLLYEVDRAAGRVRHPIALYEWVIARRAPVHRRPTPDRRIGRAHGAVLGDRGGRRR